MRRDVACPPPASPCGLPAYAPYGRGFQLRISVRLKLGIARDRLLPPARAKRGMDLIRAKPGTGSQGHVESGWIIRCSGGSQVHGAMNRWNRKVILGLSCKNRFGDQANYGPPK